MDAIKTWWGCLSCIFVLSLLAPATAATAPYEVHALPEVGKCKEVAKGTGTYRGAHCVTIASAGKGKFEWTPAGAEEFSGTASSMLLESAGHPSLKCASATLTGEWTGPKAANAEIEFTGCANSLAENCQSSPLAESVIKTGALEAQLGMIPKKGSGVMVGLDFKPKSPSSEIMSYECGSPLEMIHVEGSIIARVKPINKMEHKLSLLFVVRKGVQEPQKLEGEPKDTLTSSFVKGLETTSAPSLLSFASASLTGAPALEVKAKEHH